MTLQVSLSCALILIFRVLVMQVEQHLLRGSTRKQNFWCKRWQKLYKSDRKSEWTFIVHLQPLLMRISVWIISHMVGSGQKSTPLLKYGQTIGKMVHRALQLERRYLPPSCSFTVRLFFNTKTVAKGSLLCRILFYGFIVCNQNCMPSSRLDLLNGHMVYLKNRFYVVSSYQGNSY